MKKQAFEMDAKQNEPAAQGNELSDAELAAILGGCGKGKGKGKGK